MRIDLFPQFYDASRYSKISLRDKRCTAHVWSNAISLGSTPNACGGTREETSKYIIYKNEVILKVRQSSGMITRDHDEVIEFSCKYERDGYTSAASFLPVSSIKGNESKLILFLLEIYVELANICTPVVNAFSNYGHLQFARGNNVF